MGTFALNREGMKLLFLFVVAACFSATYAASIEGPMLSIKGLMGEMEGNNRALSWGDKPEIPREEQGERKEQLEGEKEQPEGEKIHHQKRQREHQGEKKEQQEKEEGFRGLPQQLDGGGEKQLGIKEPETIGSGDLDRELNNYETLYKIVTETRKAKGNRAKLIRELMKEHMVDERGWKNSSKAGLDPRKLFIYFTISDPISDRKKRRELIKAMFRHCC